MWKVRSKFFYIIGSVALTVAGFIIIPSLIKKYSNKMYKEAVSDEDIDFDCLGPEIVRKDTVTEEEQ